MFKKLLLISTFAVLFLGFSLPALADQTRLEGHSCIYDGVVTMDCVAPLFANLVYWLIILSGTVAVFFIIFGGIKFLTSGGVQDKVESAKKTITWSIIGLIVVLLSFMIVNIIADLTGVNCITNFGFTSCGLDKNSTCGADGFGTCGANKVCLRPNNSSSYSCVSLCSSDHRDGYCISGECLRTSETTWGCKRPCNNTSKANGFCDYPATCQKNASNNWVCKVGGT